MTVEARETIWAKSLSINLRIGGKATNSTPDIFKILNPCRFKISFKEPVVKILKWPSGLLRGVSFLVNFNPSVLSTVLTSVKKG